MRIHASQILGGIAIGIGATLVMDLWNLFLKRAFGIPSLNYCLLGRWVRHIPGGILRHASISAAPQKSFECSVGWMAHYCIGVTFALGLVLLTAGDWLARPTLLPALLYGLGTVVFPYFLMQPSFGFGIAASRTPEPTQARLKSLATHTVFGAGLYVCALAVAATGLGHGRESSSAPAPAEDPLAVVRRELNARYAENEAGFMARDPDRVMRLRHPEFHTITPDGKVSTRAQMYERTRSFIRRIERFDSLSETIVGLTLEGDTAHAVVDQRTVRQQRIGDGALHEVRTSVVQRESWVKTKEGWLLWRVDEIRPGQTLVDGKPLP